MAQLDFHVTDETNGINAHVTASGSTQADGDGCVISVQTVSS